VNVIVFYNSYALRYISMGDDIYHAPGFFPTSILTHLKIIFTMKSYFILIALLLAICSCSNQSQKNSGTETDADDTYQPAGGTAIIDSSKHPELSDPVENKRGVGKFTNVELGASLDKPMAEAGEKVYEVKCYSCHKLTDERLVGPGWKGVTSRRTPEWIMNFATNTDEMLNKDPQAQAMLEICLIRMPNQNLSDEDARKVLEFMRENDGLK
jgi:hypothetical protein